MKQHKIVLTVPDMMCPHCEATIEKALAALGAKAKANSLNKEVVVRYDDSIGEAQIRQAILDEGYRIQ